MIMLKTMARLAKCNPVGRLVSQFWMRGEMLDMVRVQFDSMAASAVQSATLAGVVISLKNCTTPKLVFHFAACYVVLVGLVNMILPACRLSALETFARIRVCNLGASLRANFPEPAALAILWHRLLTHGAWNRLFHTLSAHLIKCVKVMCSFLANLAGYADTPGIGLQSSCARYASGILDGSPQGGYGWRGLTALAARSESGAVARITNAIVSAIHLALDAPILCHIAIIPQLPDLEKSR